MNIDYIPLSWDIIALGTMELFVIICSFINSSISLDFYNLLSGIF